MSNESILKIESITIILTISSKLKKLETKSIFMDEKRYKYLTIYFTRYVHKKSIKVLSLHYHELKRKNLKKENV